MKTYYAISANGKVSRGTEVFLKSQDGWAPISLKEYEVGEVGGKLYLLVDKPTEIYLGCAPMKPKGYVWYYKSVDGLILKKDDDGNVVGVEENWIRKSAYAKQGKIFEVGDSVVVVQDKIGNRKTLRKSDLEKIPEI